MTVEDIQRALADITAETDPTLKHLKLASLVSALFRERGIELVVVGGSAIEFYTEGAYVSGDLDLCVHFSSSALTVRLRQEVMTQLQATGGPRSWQVGGLYVVVLAGFENPRAHPRSAAGWTLWPRADLPREGTHRGKGADLQVSGRLSTGA